MPAGRAILAGALAAPAFAQSWQPDRPIRLVVPFAPGGNADVVGRMVAECMSTRPGQPVAVENRAGAGGSVGAEAVARARPDGYTLMIGSNGPLTVHPALQARLPYDPVRISCPSAWRCSCCAWALRGRSAAGRNCWPRRARGLAPSGLAPGAMAARRIRRSRR